MKHSSTIRVFLALFAIGSYRFAAAAEKEAPQRVPVIYSTDLLHPHDDPDDHFDLACLFAMPEADLRAVILDNGASQATRPGFKPLWQLNHLTGRHVPGAIGLSRKLKSPDDKAFDQPAEYQNGVNLMLQTLRHSTEKVAIIFVGSARDTAAAFNREPALFREKVRSIHGFIGEASDPAFTEYNVGLDPQAFVRLVRADVPFHWIPCFDGGLWKNKGHASYWKIRHREVLERAPEPLQRYFLYMLRKSQDDPIAYLTQPTSDDDRRWLMDGQRNLWCAALLRLCLGGRIQHEGRDVSGFAPVAARVDERGVVACGPAPGAREILRFEIKEPAHFADTVNAETARLLEAFPLTDALKPGDR